MATILSDFDAKLHYPGLRKIEVAAVNAYPTVYKSIYKVEKSTKRYEEWAYRSGVGLIPDEQGENSPSAALDMSIGNVVRFRHKWKRAKFSYTERAARFDMYGALKGAAASMPQRLMLTLDLTAHTIFNNASSNTGGWDRLSLSNDAHTLVRGGTYSNKTSPMAASMQLLRVIDRYGAQIPDEYGFPTPATKVRIVVPREDLVTWKQLLGSSTEIGQANPNVINAFQGMGYEIIPSPYLDSNLWTAFVLYDEPELYWFDVDAPSSRLVNDNESDVPQMVYHVGWGGSYGWADARRILAVPAV